MKDADRKMIISKRTDQNMIVAKMVKGLDPAPISSLKRLNDPTQDKIKLSIITQFYPPDFAATGQFIEELATNLSQQAMSVQVFTGQPGYAYQMNDAPQMEVVDQVSIQRSRITHSRRKLGRTISSILFCLRSALYLIDPKHRGDLVLFVSEPPYLQTLGYLANWLFHMPYACLVYDLYPDVAVELGVVSENHWLVRFWNAVNKRVWKRSESVIVPSETMKERIAARVPEVTDKITVIHNWADPTWIKPIFKQQNSFAQAHNLVDTFTVLYSGNMGRCHDMETILGAAWELRDEPVQFLFIGAGPKREPCVKQVEKMGLTNCHFLPYQDKALLPQSLTACDLSLVSVDVGMEGLVAPSKFYSALSSGRPVAVICEKHSYLRQLVSEANCGAAFDNGDSKGLAGFIRYLAKDSQVNQQLGAAGHRFIQSNFTPELISSQYLKVLQRAVLKDADLRRAVEQQEFYLEYQPVVTLGNTRIRGFEALVRWQHPQRGQLKPAEFLSAIEESGLIIPLGWWLINQACYQLRQWQTEMLDEHTLGIRINLSSRQFLQPDLIPQIDRILDSNNVKAGCLTLQISEESLMVDPAAATAILMQLRSRHIQVCLDGFGKGVASLSYLHRFPITAIEIDRSLIGRLESDPEVAKLIGTIMALAQDLEIEVTAEGIETLHQLQQLKAIGIQQGQGHWFSQAVQPERILSLLHQHNQVRFISASESTHASEPTEIGDTVDSHPSPNIPLVLIADDEKLMRTLLRRAVEKEGYRVAEAESGEQALILYRQLQPNMVLLDAMMPEMDGFACCSQLRQVAAATVRSLDNQAVPSDISSSPITDTPEPETSEGAHVLNHCPVLIITSLDDTESVDRAFEAGATDYITKPVNWAVLRQRLHRLLDYNTLPT